MGVQQEKGLSGKIKRHLIATGKTKKRVAGEAKRAPGVNKKWVGCTIETPQGKTHAKKARVKSERWDKRHGEPNSQKTPRRSEESPKKRTQGLQRRTEKPTLLTGRQRKVP